jgi:hypothetical protein
MDPQLGARFDNRAESDERGSDACAHAITNALLGAAVGDVAAGWLAQRDSDPHAGLRPAAKEGRHLYVFGKEVCAVGQDADVFLGLGEQP